MAKQQTLTFIVPDGAADPVELVEAALLYSDYGLITNEVVDPDKFKALGGVIVIVEED